MEPWLVGARFSLISNCTGTLWDALERSGTLWDGSGTLVDALGRSGMAHDSARTDPRWPKTAPREPKIASGTPKTASRWPQDGPREPKIAPRRLKITPGWPKMAPRWPRLPLSWACLGPSWHPPKILKNPAPGGHRFGPPNGPQNVDFSLQITAFSEQTGFQKMIPKLGRSGTLWDGP